MNTPQDDGGPAFPSKMLVNRFATEETAQQLIGADGMSLRDWLAKEGARMHAEGLLALGIQPSSRWHEIAAEGLRFADAMIAARKETL